MDTTREILKKTTTGPNQEQRDKAKQQTGIFQARYMVYYILGVIEILLLFRLGLKISGANPASGFVSFIYSITNLMLSPFAGIFHTTTTQGIETIALFEPSALVALIVFAIVGWGIASLINVLLTRI